MASNVAIPDHYRDEFDPKSVTIPRLRSILLEMDVKATSNLKKQELIQLFESKARPKQKTLRDILIKIKPSSHGMVDVGSSSIHSAKKQAKREPERGDAEDAMDIDEEDVEGTDAGGEEDEENELIVKGPKPRGKPPKKSQLPTSASVPSLSGTKRKHGSRVSSVPSKAVVSQDEVTSGDEMDVDVPQGDLPLPRKKAKVSSISKGETVKGRKSSLAANAGPATMDVVIEDNPPVKKARKSSSSAANTPRRKSTMPTSGSIIDLGSIEEDAANVSGFSDYNPFQSGAESSSPASGKKKARKSILADPGTTGPAPTPAKRAQSAAFPSQVKVKREDQGGTVRPSGSLGDINKIPRPPTVQVFDFQHAGKVSSPPTASPTVKLEGPILSLRRKSSDDVQASKSVVKQSPRAPSQVSTAQSVGRPRQSQPSSVVSPVLSERRKSIVDRRPSAIPRHLHDEFPEPSPTPDFTYEEPQSQATTPFRSAPAGLTKKKSPASRAMDAVSDALARPVLGRGKDRQGMVGGPIASTSSALTRISNQSQALVKESPTKAVSLATLLVLFLGYLSWFRYEKSVIGFCDAGRSYNALIRDREHERYLGRSQALSEKFPALPVVESIVRDALSPSCMPCPPHAVCANGRVSCQDDYVLKTHPVLSLGGLIPVAPSCEPDTDKLIKTAEEASRINKILRVHRGDVVCSGKESRKRRERRDEWYVYGVQESVLKEILDASAATRKDKSDRVYTDLVPLAIEDLRSHGDIVVGQDENGETWVASKAADMPLTCRAKLAVIDYAGKKKKEMSMLFLAFLGIAYLRFTRAQSKIEDQEARQMVREVLRRLQTQEFRHHTDPVLTPNPYSSSAHLRDDILAHEPNPIRRQKKWRAVEKIVEGNTNVRINQAEVHGEATKTWQWVGGTNQAIEYDTPTGSARKSVMGASSPIQATFEDERFGDDRQMSQTPGSRRSSFLYPSLR